MNKLSTPIASTKNGITCTIIIIIIITINKIVPILVDNILNLKPNNLDKKFKQMLHKSKNDGKCRNIPQW